MSQSLGPAFALELIDGFRRSWWTVIAGLALGISGALFALHHLPKIYESTTKILIAPPRIPQDLVRTTVSDDISLRMTALRDAVLSRSYLERLIKEVWKSKQDFDQLERQMNLIRSRVTVESHLGRGEQSGYFLLTYQDEDPERAAQVVNLLADYYIQENTRFRSARAGETTTTLEGLADGIRVQLEDRERKIAAFRSQHLYDNPDQLEANLRLLESRQRELDTNQKAMATAKERLELWKQGRDVVQGGAHGVNGAVLADPYQLRVAQVRRDLDQLKLRYLETHPEVRAKQRELDDLLAHPPSNPVNPQSGEPTAAPGPEEVLEREVARLEQEQAKIKSDIELYKARVEATPKAEQELRELTKGYDVLQQQYRDYVSKVQSARGAETVEEAQKGEQFQVLDRGSASNIPVAPNVPMIYAVGLGAGLLLFAFPPMLFDLLRPKVRSEAGLTLLVDVPVLVSIPRLETRTVRRSRASRLALNVLFSMLALTAMAYAIVLFS